MPSRFPTPSVGSTINFAGLPLHWTEDHVPALVLDALRQVGDDIADDALKALEVWVHTNPKVESKGKDTLTLMYLYLKAQVSSDGVGGATEKPDAVRKFVEDITTVPEWVDWDAVARGQRVFWKYFGVMANYALLHCALVGGVAAKDPIGVLLSTGYLTRPGRPTRKRLIETLLWLIDCMVPGALVPGGTGWKSTVRVRLLHTKVRTRLVRLCEKRQEAASQGEQQKDGQNSKGAVDNVGGNSAQSGGRFEYSVEAHGIPINQEDMIATILEFTEAFFFTARRLGIPLSDQEMIDYLTAFRLIAWYMGVHEDITGDVLAVKRAASNGITAEEEAAIKQHPLKPWFLSGKYSEIWFESIALHTYDPDEGSKLLANNLLSAVSEPETGDLEATQRRDAVRLKELTNAHQASGNSVISSTSLRIHAFTILFFLRKHVLHRILWVIRRYFTPSYTYNVSLSRIILGDEFMDSVCVPRIHPLLFLYHKLRLYAIAIPLLRLSIRSLDWPLLNGWLAKFRIHRFQKILYPVILYHLRRMSGQVPSSEAKPGKQKSTKQQLQNGAVFKFGLQYEPKKVVSLSEANAKPASTTLTATEKNGEQRVGEEEYNDDWDFEEIGFQEVAENVRILRTIRANTKAMVEPKYEFVGIYALRPLDFTGLQIIYLE
ncbi:hypothetical protein HK102_003516 [Quaeritorhiza haematococci]|nr:hypothetical protein HK102_003516 [Quaeritorhiza haematococci]